MTGNRESQGILGSHSDSAAPQRHLSLKTIRAEAPAASAFLAFSVKVQVPRSTRRIKGGSQPAAPALLRGKPRVMSMVSPQRELFAKMSVSDMWEECGGAPNCASVWGYPPSCQRSGGSDT